MAPTAAANGAPPPLTLRRASPTRRTPPAVSTSRPSPTSWRTAATRSGCAKSGRAGTPSRSRCGRTTSALPSCRIKGADELGFPDTGAMWRSKYDMPPDAFAAEMDRLWEQVRPLYLSLHAYMRMKLRERYGDLVPEKGPIPAHLLGNIWAQSWENLYPDVAPTTGAKAYDLTKILAARKTSAVDMVKFGERFFVSLGQAPLPPTFYERSLLVKPRDREVVCHASAWDDRSRRRCADQDVHRRHGRRLHGDSSRAGPQLLPARLQASAGAVPRQRQRRFSRGDWRHDRACR